MQADTRRKGRWYFGGLSSAGAACCTHPLDLLKVHLQTGSGVASKAKDAVIKQEKINLLGHVTKVSTTFN